MKRDCPKMKRRPRRVVRSMENHIDTDSLNEMDFEELKSFVEGKQKIINTATEATKATISLLNERQGF